VGVLSYSIYLWQQPFLNTFETARQTWTCFPANLALAMGVSLASYFLVELPFLQWRVALRADALRRHPEPDDAVDTMLDNQRTDVPSAG
jgi:peptidoglycan/LPS O-acetylase OafA/YrhL